MRIGLYNLEPKYKNLALEKIRLFYTNHKHTAENCDPFEFSNYDMVYASSIFDFTNKRYIPPNVITGGTGFNLKTVLPSEIDTIEPHLNFGFTSRGCIRKCKFCVVPQKEGYVKATGDLLSLWDGKSKDVVLLDNNILALPDHFDRICRQARENKIRIDFNQGLDHRLLTPELIELMVSISHVEYRFAFDDPAYLPSVENAISLLKAGGINRALWYVLVGFNTSFDDDLMRLNYLRDNNQRAFVQRYRGKDNKLTKLHTNLARWVNRHDWFYSLTWDQFLKRQYNGVKLN